MFDLKASVTYRGFDLNDADRNAAAGPSVGSRLDEVGWPGVRGIGYTEKKARSDGLDSSDVYLYGRRFAMRGSIFGATRGDTFDRANALITAFMPTLAYEDDSDAQGYLPLAGSQPTDLTDDFPTGTKDIYLNVRPLASPVLGPIQRDRSGGDDTLGFAIPWAVEVEAKDPRIYLTDVTSASLGASGDLDHRGNYPTPLVITIVAAQDTLATLRFVGLGSDLTITLDDADTVDQTIVYDAAAKTLLRTVAGQTTLRMDLISFDAARMHPHVPAGGGSYTTTKTGTSPSSATVTASYHEAFA